MDALGELTARVEALEAAGKNANETLIPNYLTIDPVTGAIGADFTGLLHALGVILPAATLAVPAQANQVEWTRQSDGAVVARIWGHESQGFTNRIEIDGLGVSAGESGQAIVRGQSPSGNTIAQLVANADDNGSAFNQFVEVNATPAFGFLLRGDGSSTWLQTGGASNLSQTGTLTLTWPAIGNSLSNVVNVKLPGATGDVDAVATVQSLIPGTLAVPTVRATPDLAGGVDFEGQLPTGAAAPPNVTVDVAFLMWGN